MALSLDLQTARRIVLNGLRTYRTDPVAALASILVTMLPEVSGSGGGGGGSGSVTSIATGTGLTGGPITTTGTVAIDTAVVPQKGTTNTFTQQQTLSGGAVFSGTDATGIGTLSASSVEVVGLTPGQIPYAASPNSLLTDGPRYNSGTDTVTATAFSASGYELPGVAHKTTLAGAAAPAADRTVTLPDATGTVALVGHTHDAGDITSGTLGVAKGGTGADLTLTGGAGQVLKQATTGAAVTVGTLSASDVGAAAASHTHTAGDITSGQLAVARGGTGADLSATGGTGKVLKQATTGAAVTVAALTGGDVAGLVPAEVMGIGAQSIIDAATHVYRGRTLTASDFPSGRTVTWEAEGLVSRAGLTATVVLYNVTTSAAIATLTFTSTSYSQQTASVTLTSGANRYEIQVTITSGFAASPDTFTLYGAALMVR